ncbi:uncharacterized protein LOC113067545 [Carassius auratus]|uniref:Uncharacterized protein LOC113067545 n=1 Tax=Carassius auratus TaxID=7957 RepID=A0A6P6MI66_CARAU|nr:uncharacterized protein LOC113067545 [Carassius auratus]
MMDILTCILRPLLIMMVADGLIVHGPSDPLVAPLGSSVVLPCYVDELLSMKDLEVEWRRTGSETLVHLYQDGESRPESQHQDYRDRAHFFTDQIQHGNFSLRLDNLRPEDEEKYICKVYSQKDSGETVVQIKHERLLVSGSDRSVSAYVGEDVTLNCSVDSHITPEHIEEVSWKKTDEDEDILVLLYQNNQTFPDASHERYRDRVKLFTAQIPKGNFSLRLKSVRTEDKGVYMCKVFAGGLSANATVVLEQLGFSSWHIAVLFFCFAAGSGAVLLLLSLIYCRSDNTVSTSNKIRKLELYLVFCPNICMFLAFILWGFTEGFLYETIFCCALYILRPLTLIYVASYLEKMSGIYLRSELFIFMMVYFSVLLSRAWGNIGHYAESEKITLIAVFVVMILLFVINFIYLFTEINEMSCRGEICEWIWNKLTFIAAFSFFILPSLQFTLLFIAFRATGGGFLISIIFPFLFFLTFTCLPKSQDKSCSNMLNVISWMMVMFIMTAVMMYFYIAALKNEKDGAGWTCTAVFVQVLWMIGMYIHITEDLDLTIKKMLFVFGSVGVVLLNSVTLMTELILKTVHGERVVDMRVVVFTSESLFVFALLVLLLFQSWISDIKCQQCCQKAVMTESNQNQDSQTEDLEAVGLT